MPVRSTVITLALAPAFLSIALAGCAQQPTPEPESTGALPLPSSSATAPAGPPELVQFGTAADNLPYFDEVNQASIAAKGAATGRVMIDGLERAGFDKATMQVTPDKTAIGLDADSVQFSAIWARECLVGQVDGSKYYSVVLPLLGDGTCLVGKTRTIDW
jgi:hypothetical protein